MAQALTDALLVVNESKNISLGAQIFPAKTFWQRLVGLSFHQALPAGQGLYLSNCKSIHTFGMRFPIDVVFLDASHHVIDVIERLPPNRLTRFHPDAADVLELPPGVIGEFGITPGDLLRLESIFSPSMQGHRADQIDQH